MSREFQLIEKEAIFGIESQGIENLLKGEYIGNTGLFERGVSALLMFMQQSFTGPTLNLEEKVIDLKLLSIDGEDIYHLTPHAYLLLEAKQILIDNASDIQGFESLDWWAARTAFVHQRILEEHSATLKSLILSLYEKMQSFVEKSNCPALQARYNLEIGIVYHYYGQDAKAVEYFTKAQECTGLRWNVTGVMGKRTKFQQFETSQLAISAISNLSIGESTKVPEKLNLNDDTLLESTALTTNQMDNFKGNLNPVDQSILLAFCLNVKNTNPDDGLTTEEMLPYVSRVLENPNNWMITTMALLLRSRLEAHRSRTVERSCLQLQTLVDQWKEQENDASPSERMLHIFSLLVPSKWDMEKELGLRFISIGVLRSALEIFERLQMWENVISCHQMLEQPKKAEELIKNLLKDTPNSPKLWCLLGDVQGETAHFEKAWELSNHRYSRAMRSLGARYFHLQDWQNSVECYQKALAINPLFENSWFVMGCAALRIDDYEVAANAFSRVTQLDSGNSEAWNNLASVYIKLKKLTEAFRCLKEAIKVNYEAANIWENYLFVSVDVGEFGEAIRAMERIFTIRIEKQSLKESAVDEQVLEIIVTAVNQNVQDANGQPCSVYAKKLYNLLELITSKYASHTLFLICALFYKGQSDHVKSLDYYTKAYRHTLHNPEIMESATAFNELARTTLMLADAYYEFRNETHIPRMGSEPTLVCADWGYQAKMALKAVIGRTKAIYGGSPEHDQLSEKLAFIIQESRK